MRFKGWRHTQPKVFTRGVKRRPDQDRRPERRTGAEGSLRRRRFTRELKRASDRALRAGLCSAAFLSRVPVRRTRRHLFDFTPGLKWSMLEICPLALCAYGRRVFRRWQSHSWLCFVRREVATTCYRITSPVSAPFHAAGSATSRAQIATFLESNSCTKTPNNRIRIILLRKNIGGHPLAASLCCLGPLLPLRLAE